MNRDVCVKPEFMYGHVCHKFLETHLVGRVVRVSDDLSSSSSCGRGGIVAKLAVVTAVGCSDEFLWP